MALFDFGKKRIEELEAELVRLRTANQAMAQQNQAMAQRIQELTAQEAQLRQFLDRYGGPAAWQAKEALERLKSERALVQAEADEVRRAAQADADEWRRAAQADVHRLQQEETRLQKVLHPQRLQALEEAVGLTPFEHPAGDSIALGSQLRTLRSQITAMARGHSAVSSADQIEIPTTKTGLNKLAKDLARIVARAFNAEVENIITSVTPGNYEASLAKIAKSAEALERLGASANIKVSPQYVEARARELKLAADHLSAKQLERELERERKTELREQAKAERELAAERERLEKEKQHYLNVLRTVEQLGDDAETQKIRDQIIAIDKGINDVEVRTANIRAGYVYVISNIGAFGDSMVKIGMTRRLDPMDRVRELSDASVPFNFDVHALFFSDDAVGVEAELHRRFAAQRVNLVNQRREFFAVTPAQVKEQLASIAGNLLEFIDEAEAEQYRESQRIRQQQGEGGAIPRMNRDSFKPQHDQNVADDFNQDPQE